MRRRSVLSPGGQVGGCVLLLIVFACGAPAPLVDEMDGGIDDGGLRLRKKPPEPPTHLAQWQHGPYAWHTLKDPNHVADPLEMSTEVVVLPGVFDAIEESGGMPPSMSSRLRASPIHDAMEDPEMPTLKPPCDQGMTMGDIYGADVASDRMTGGIRGDSLSYPSNRVDLLPVPNQETITKRCDTKWHDECDQCARRFRAAGGCDKDSVDGDISMMIDWGCAHCETAAQALCRGDDKNPCPRIRLRGVPALVPSVTPEFITYPPKEHVAWTEPRSDREPCPPPPIRTEEQPKRSLVESGLGESEIRISE